MGWSQAGLGSQYEEEDWDDWEDDWWDDWDFCDNCNYNLWDYQCDDGRFLCTACIAILGAVPIDNG